MAVFSWVIQQVRSVRTWRLALALLLLGSIMGVVAAMEGRPVQATATFTVTSTGDHPDASPGDGVCKTAVSTCTLRAAIMEGNALPGPDNVEFNILTLPPYVIAPASPLPGITEYLNIDGATEPDYGGTPVIELDGVSAGAGAAGLYFNSGGVVRALAIYRFPYTGVGVSYPGGLTVQRSYLGTNGAGDPGLGNGNGVVINDAQINTIGGAGNGNVISGNTAGIFIHGSVNGAVLNDISHNYIGLAPNGVTGLGNDTGILTFPDSGFNSFQYNNIAANKTGILLGGSSNDQVSYNYIGVSVPNVYYGVLAASSGPASIFSNLVFGNSGAGIFIDSGSTGVNAYDNSINANGGLGIDLNGTGVDANDTGDGDGGGNGGQNYPVLASSSGYGSSTISGSLNSTANTSFTIHFYASPSCDPSGHGEGYAPLGSTTVATDASGNVSFSATVGGVPEVSVSITATATGPDGTSEFSACVGHDLDGDGCSDVEELGDDPQAGGGRNPLNPWDFYDVNGDKGVELSDALLILNHFGHGPGDDALDNLLDRWVPNPAFPWQSDEANDGPALDDALANLKQFGHDCSGAP